jgi:hypothetical protein
MKRVLADSELKYTSETYDILTENGTSRSLEEKDLIKATPIDVLLFF